MRIFKTWSKGNIHSLLKVGRLQYQISVSRLVEIAFFTSFRSEVKEITNSYCHIPLNAIAVSGGTSIEISCLKTFKPFSRNFLGYFYSMGDNAKLRGRNFRKKVFPNFLKWGRQLLLKITQSIFVCLGCKIQQRYNIFRKCIFYFEFLFQYKKSSSTIFFVAFE